MYVVQIKKWWMYWAREEIHSPFRKSVREIFKHSNLKDRVGTKYKKILILFAIYFDFELKKLDIRNSRKKNKY